MGAWTAVDAGTEYCTRFFDAVAFVDVRVGFCVSLVCGWGEVDVGEVFVDQCFSPLEVRFRTPA